MKLNGAFKCCFGGKLKVGGIDAEDDDLDFLAPSVHHLATEFLEGTVKDAGFDENSTIYDIEDLRKKDECGVIRKKGLGVTCPIDGRLHAAYVHSLKGEDHVGRATFMLSYAWKSRIGDITESLLNYCKEKGLSPKRVYVWICCLCINQHRVVEGGTVELGNFQHTFRHRLQGIGHILALMAPWQLPEYLRRIWCIFEMYEAYTIECKVEIIMPPEQEKLLLNSITSTANAEGKNGIKELLTGFSTIRVENASASQPEDRDNILRIIENGPGYAVFNTEINNYMRQWVVSMVRASVAEAQKRLKDDDLPSQEIIEMGTYMSYIAAFFGENGDKRTSLDFYLEALEAYESADPNFDENIHDVKDYIARTYNNIGGNLEALGRYTEALEYHGKCCVQFEEVYGKDHINTSASYFNIGAVKRKQEDYEGALEMFLKSVEIDERTNGTYHPDTANTYDYIGRTKQAMGDLDGALEMFNKNLVSWKMLLQFEEVYGKDHINTSASYFNIGAVKRKQEDYEGALEMFLKSVEIDERTNGTYHPDTANTYDYIGRTKQAMGDLDGALEMFNKNL
eukprot:CAMPEP_0204642094 /NCGR_PEP_ID=MMETSP0717-20131115/51499_1 /ASSEMBLY_ACC=CAM_ASM_000666 /TAXON_ID=230516 /ORGANISM="Chaetoceros curvisetus" /LENGTH=566 /DNA_ID=CAMNT_0051662835 /DNA_START=48 /DNA_END=1749 /DNA_ORIENTATION=-